MGFVGFMYRQKMVHPQPITSQNLAGQTALITESNVDIGLAATSLLMESQLSCVTMAVRTVSKGQETAEDLLRTHPDCDVKI